ncbi:hypothetical protein [Rhodomicrobium lacus]|uniref:hypothetical protein n=1 Tax=Rhodomicrobium lacus TaxID=2498452 RepID=UPI000F8E8606|nr:hypothetical protein [Rhodomicrobium lacus]
MLRISIAAAAVAFLAASPLAASAAEKTLALKSNETSDIMPLYGVKDCKSLLTATPEIEVLQGAPELTLSVRPDKILPPGGKCKDKVDGGVVVATVGKVEKPFDGPLTFRVKYKTKDATRQSAHTFDLKLFP